MIEVGEYVRIKGGHIHKVTKIDNNKLVYWGNIQCGWSLEQLEDIILKHSKNIIDLIEVDDIVNGGLIYSTLPNNSKIYSEEFGEIAKWEEDEIETILTHEQYEANCYRLEENK